MQLSELVTKIQRVITDDTYTETIIKALINEAVLVVATGVQMEAGISPPLPELFTNDTIATVAGTYASLPSDYNRDVMLVLNAAKSRMKIKSSFEAFLISHPDQTAGAVYECAVLGDYLYYRDIPAAPETLTVYYYKNPTTLSGDTDTPSEIPEVLHRQLILGYVLNEIYNQIELGVEGQKVDTQNYGAMFQNGLVRLKQLIPVWG